MTRRQYLLVAIFAILAILPTGVHAAGMVQVVPESCNDKGGCRSICDIAKLAQNILINSIFVAVFLSAILFAWAGLRMLMSPANQSEYGKAKNLFYNVLIGFIIILSAWLVIDTLMHVMLGSKIGPWNSICTP